MLAIKAFLSDHIMLCYRKNESLTINEPAVLCSFMDCLCKDVAFVMILVSFSSFFGKYSLILAWRGHELVLIALFVVKNLKSGQHAYAQENPV